jgi:hypothetical protein
MAWWDQRYNALTGQGSTTPTNTGGTNTPVKTNNEWWSNRYNTLQADEQWKVQNTPVTPVQVQPAQPVQPKKGLLQKVEEGVKNLFSSDVPEPDTTPIQTHSTEQPAQKSFIDFLFTKTPDKYKSKNILENLNPLKSLKRGVSAAQETLAKPEYTQVRSGMAMVQGQLSIDKQIENIQNALQKSADKDVASDYSLEDTMKGLEPKKGFVSPAELDSYRTNIFKEVIDHPATYMAEAQKYIEPIITGNQFTGKMSKSVTDFFLGIAGGSKKADAMWQEKLKEPVTTEDKVLSTAGDVAGTVLSLIGGGAILKGFGLAKVSAPLLYEVMGQESLPKDTGLEDRFKKAPLYLVAGWLTSKVGLPKKLLSMETLTGATKTGAILSGQAYIDYLTRGYSPKETADIALKMAGVGLLYHIGFSAASVAIRPKTGSVSNVEFTPSELRSRVVGSPYQDTEFGKYLTKLSIEAESSGKNISLNAQALGKSPLAKTLGTKAPNGLNVDAKLVDPNPQLKTTTNTAKDTKTAQPEAKQALSTEVSKVPEKPQTSTQIMEKAGWPGGDKSKSVFDLALYKKDAVTIKQMLPDVPQYYKEKFATEIAKITGESPIAPATTATPVTPSVKTVTPTKESVSKFPIVFIKNADKYVRVEDFADSIEGSNPQDQVGVLDPKTITARDPIEQAKVDKMVEDIKSGNAKEMPPIVIERTDAGNLQTFEGSHRVTSYGVAEQPVPVIYHGKDPIPGLIKIEDLYKLLNEKTATQKDIQPQEVKKPSTERVVEPKPQKGLSTKVEFKVGDTLDPQGNTNMVGTVTIREVSGNTLKFVDSKGTEFSGMQRSTVRNLINGGSWKRVEENKPKTRISAKSKKKEMEKIEKQARAEASPFSNPEVEQYSGVIGRAEKVYNLSKRHGKEDISTITKKVKGLDEALEALRNSGYTVETMDDLIALKKRGSTAEGSRPKESMPRENQVVARTPEELKEILDNLNKFGQAHAIPRKFGGIKNPQYAGLYVHAKGSKTGEVMLKEKYMAGDREYVSTLAHELGHATEHYVTGEVNKNTLNVFGKDNHQEILKELKEVTLKLEGAEAIAQHPVYFNRPTELLARFFEMYITNPELLKDTAPTAFEALERQSITFPILREYLDITDEAMQKADKVGFQFLPDRRETYQKYLGKKVGNIAFDQELVHRAMVERAKIVIPKFISSKFKGVKDKPELLFRVAESVRTTKEGTPEFGTRDLVELPTVDRGGSKAEALKFADYEVVQTLDRGGIETDIYAKYRHTPEEAKALYNQLTPEGKELIKDFTAQLSEAKDLFNRELIKDIYKINSDLEGWVHHYFEGDPKRTTMSGKGLKFKEKTAAAAKHRTGTEGYVEDLQKATTKALTELQMTKEFNSFVEKQFARVSKPIRKGENPDTGWVEVVGDVKKGIGLEADKRMIVIEDGKSVLVKRTRYQIPSPVFERYNKYRGLVQEASGVAKMLQRVNSYWAVNILTDAGTAGTNFIGGGIQYSAKVLTDFYTELLTGKASLPQTRRNVTALLKVLLPRGWADAPDYIYGADQSNWYGMFQNKNLGKADKAIDKFADTNLKLFGTYERYWKKVISTAENVGDLRSLQNITKEGLRLPTLEEEKLIANINKETDLYAYDYDNVPMWLANMKKNPVMVGFKPFATYPYKYAKQISKMVGGVFDRQKSWQERVSKLLALVTIVGLYSAYSLSRKEKQQTPEGTSEIDIRARTGGYLFTGMKDAEGKELFVRISKYPFFGLTEAGIQLMRGNTASAGNILKEILGSVGFVGDMGLGVMGYRSEYEKFDDPQIVLGNNLSGLVPYTRVLSEVSRGLDPFQRKQKTLGQTLTKLVPTTEADLQEKLHGEARSVKIPIEGEVKRTPGTPYTRTTVDRALKNYWQDILLSSLTGIYIKRVSPEDVAAQLIRDDENKKKKEKEDAKKSKEKNE